MDEIQKQLKTLKPSIPTEKNIERIKEMEECL